MILKFFNNNILKKIIIVSRSDILIIILNNLNKLDYNYIIYEKFQKILNIWNFFEIKINMFFKLKKIKYNKKLNFFYNYQNILI